MVAHLNAERGEAGRPERGLGNAMLLEAPDRRQRHSRARYVIVIVQDVNPRQRSVRSGLLDGALLRHAELPHDLF